MSKAHQLVKNSMSLAGFFRRFPDDEAAEAWFASKRWPDGARCGHCGSDNVAVVKSRRPMPFRCRKCRRHFSVKTGTPMRDSNLGAQTWLLAIFLEVANPKGRSSVQMAADLGITQKSAWHLGHRVRKALADGTLPDFDGPVEVDETYIGGKARNRHRRQADPGKTAVMAAVDRTSRKATATPVHRVTMDTAEAMVRSVAADGAEVHTDGSTVYDGLSELGFDHHRVIHSIGEYVRGSVTTNSAENYFSLLKRTYIGTYHYWSPEHCHRYVEEHNFRYNRRDRHVIDKMADAVDGMEGRSLPWRELVAQAA